MKGSIVINGNIRMDHQLVERFGHRMLESHHVDPEVREWRKVLLITAAWQRREFAEEHLKEALREVGIPSRFRGGFDQNIQNLALYHQFDAFTREEPSLYDAYHEKQEVIIRTKEFYRRKNVDFLAILREQAEMVKETFPGTSMADILRYDVAHHQEDLTRFDERELFFHYGCQDVQDTLSKLVENDTRMLKICEEIEDYFRRRSRVDENATYIAMRDELRRRILSANSVLIMGGNAAVLLNRLQFFRLHEAFREALWRGTNFYTVSAGSMVLAEKLIMFDDFWGDGEVRPRKEFEFFDRGLGLVSRVALFPHCMDRIQTDDPDNLSYLAHRFSTGPCVGLNQESFLLAESFQDPGTGGVRERFVSVGELDGVYVFDREGRKICRRKGEEIELDG